MGAKREAEADAYYLGGYGAGYAGVGYAGLGHAGLGYAGLGHHAVGYSNVSPSASLNIAGVALLLSPLSEELTPELDVTSPTLLELSTLPKNQTNQFHHVFVDIEFLINT